METFKFDPRDFIVSPFSRCGACGKDALGILNVGDHRVVRRCRECMQDAHERLPELDKRIVYLDQFVISNITKALNPAAPNHERARQNPVWVELYGLLDVLVRAQVLVCPHFENHRTESIYSRFYPALKWLYDRLSGGAGLHGSEYFKRQQLAEAASAWLRGTPPEFTVSRSHAIRGKFNVWLDNIRFVIKGSYPDDVDEMRSAREQGHANLTATFERWRTETSRSFADWYEEERRAFGPVCLQIYQDWARRYVRVSLGVEPFSLNATWPPEPVSTITALAAHLEGRGVPARDALPKVFEFLQSDAVLEIPYLRISSAMYATIAMKAAGGQRTPPNQGTFADVTAVATLLPVCDAMVIDDKCEALLRDIPRSHRPDYPTRLFSTRTLQDFVTYLRELLAGITPEHRALLDRVYGTNWATPNLKLFDQLT